MQVHRPPARLLSFLHLHFLLPRIIVVLLLSFGAMCAGFLLRPSGILPDTWRDTRLKRNSNAAFVQKRFTAKITYVDTRDYMDIQAILLFDVPLLLIMLLEKGEEKSLEVEE